MLCRRAGDIWYHRIYRTIPIYCHFPFFSVACLLWVLNHAFFMTGTYISCLMTIFAHHYWALVDQALVTFPVRDVKSSSLQFKAASHCSLFVSLEWLRKKSVDSWAHFKQEALVKILFFVVLAIHWSYNCWSSVLLVI